MLLRRLMATALAALSALLLIAALACGPVAPEDLPTPAAIQQPAPLSDPGVAETPILTHTPDPLPPKPTPLPNLPPKPTPLPNLPPKPTPLPTLPPKPTETPFPTLIPPEQVTPSFAHLMQPHPRGLAGCREYSMFGSPSAEVAHLDWCTEELAKEVLSACSGLATSEATLACSRRELADVKHYLTREGIIRCIALTDAAARSECSNQSSQRVEQFFTGLFEMWPKVQGVVDRDSAVATALMEVITCLEDLGYEEINPELLFPWQVVEDPTVYDEREAGYTEVEKAMRLELWEPADQCARQHGFYEAQDAAWLAEVERLAKEEPEAAKPLLDAGLLDILRAPGVAAFLRTD